MYSERERENNKEISRERKREDGDEEKDLTVTHIRMTGNFYRINISLSMFYTCLSFYLF